MDRFVPGRNTKLGHQEERSSSPMNWPGSVKRPHKLDSNRPRHINLGATAIDGAERRWTESEVAGGDRLRFAVVTSPLSYSCDFSASKSRKTTVTCHIYPRCPRMERCRTKPLAPCKIKKLYFFMNLESMFGCCPGHKCPDDLISASVALSFLHVLTLIQTTL